MLLRLTSYMTVNWTSLGFGLLVRQNKTSEDVIFGSEKLWMGMMTFHRPNQRSNNQGNDYSLISNRITVSHSPAANFTVCNYNNQTEIDWFQKNKLKWVRYIAAEHVKNKKRITLKLSGDFLAQRKSDKALVKNIPRKVDLSTSRVSTAHPRVPW